MSVVNFVHFATVTQPRRKRFRCRFTLTFHLNEPLNHCLSPPHVYVRNSRLARKTRVFCRTYCFRCKDSPGVETLGAEGGGARLCTALCVTVAVVLHRRRGTRLDANCAKTRRRIRQLKRRKKVERKKNMMESSGGGASKLSGGFSIVFMMDSNN